MGCLVQEQYVQFIDENHQTLFEMMHAANYMDIKSLVTLLGATLASKIKGKSVEEIRETFNIVKTYTQEEAARFLELNPWVNDL